MFSYKEYTHGYKMLFFPNVKTKNRHVFTALFLVALFSLTIHIPTPALAATMPYEYSPNTFTDYTKDAQTLTVSKYNNTPIVVERFEYEIIAAPEPVIPKKRPAPNAAVVGEAQAYARTLVSDDNEWNCLYNLWARESGWRVEAYNASSGATGIPQALPGSKMASAGADWETNPVTQINWGMGYINGRYGTPCNAWAHSEEKGWY